jgi:hypothetical protein
MGATGWEDGPPATAIDCRPAEITDRNIRKTQLGG